MHISPITQHGLNLWKHAAEVSIDYCTSCMNGLERHNLSTCCWILELSRAVIKLWNIHQINYERMTGD